MIVWAFGRRKGEEGTEAVFRGIEEKTRVDIEEDGVGREKNEVWARGIVVVGRMERGGHRNKSLFINGVLGWRGALLRVLRATVKVNGGLARRQDLLVA
jgi:hypothetical protein